MANTPLPLNAANVKDQIEKNLKAIILDCQKYKISVGIPGDQVNTTRGHGYTNKNGELKKKILKNQPPASVALYAASNEFGVVGDKSKGVVARPARPAFRTAFKRGSTYLTQLQKVAVKYLSEMAIQNRDAKTYLTKLGLYAAGLIKKNIRESQWAPNAPSTIARKGSSKPLIDTGTESRTVTAWVGNR